MRLAFFGIAAILLSFLLAPEAQGQYTCDVETCVLPDCFCATTDPVPHLAPADVPQFIVLSFDDAVNGFSEAFIEAALGGVQVPGGGPVPRTYFANKQYSQVALIAELYAAGHEMANHTAFHESGGSVEGWIEGMTELHAFLVEDAGVPSDQIVGFRAPYLVADNAMWLALHALGYLYDSSYSERVSNPPLVSTGLGHYVWPHTLDHGLGLSCTSSPCPTQPVPGVWTIPMWVHVTEGGIVYNMDPAPASPAEFAALLDYMFTLRYEGNRTPLGIHMHAGQMWNPDRQAVLGAFLEDRLAQPDVWVVTMRGLVEWMRHPVPVSEMAGWLAQGCDRGWCVAGERAAPPAITLSAPLGGAVVGGQPVAMRWQAHSNAAAYHLQIATDAGFSGLVVDQAALSAAQAAATDLPSGVPLYWRVRGANPVGAGAWSEVRTFSIGATSAEGTAEASALHLAVYPNPVRGEGHVSIRLAEPGPVRVRVLDVLGREVAMLAEGALPAGGHVLALDASGLATGTYLLVAETARERTVRRITVAR